MVVIVITSKDFFLENANGKGVHLISPLQRTFALRRVAGRKKNKRGLIELAAVYVIENPRLGEPSHCRSRDEGDK